MAPRRKISQPIDEAPVPANDLSGWTDELLIARNHELEALIKQATQKLAEWAKPHKVEIAGIEGELRRRLDHRGADSTSTDAGTAYFSNIMNTKVEDSTKLFDFIADNWDRVGTEIQLNLKVDAVRDWMGEHDGATPPGMSVSYYKRLNIKRS